MNIHPHNLIDVLLWGICFATAFFRFKNKEYLETLVCLCVGLIPIFIATAYWSIFRQPLSLFALINLRDLFGWNIAVGFLLLISISVFVSSVFIELLKSEKKSAVFVTIALFWICSHILYEDPDFDPSSLHRKNGFHSTLIGEFSFKGFALISNPRKEGEEFYLEKYYSVKAPEKLPDIFLGVFESLFLDQKLRAFVANKKFFDQFQPIKNSTFAGESARSEFELLCGVPSLKVWGIEFNIMTGHNKPCLPKILADLGYETVVTNTNPAWMFNARQAYRQVGLSRQRWLKEESTMVKGGWREFDAPGDYIFDGELLSEVNKINTGLKTTSSAPVFHYFVGGYGHTPYKRNTTLRPTVIYDDNVIYQKVLNQNYYRLIELEAFIETLKKKFNDSIVILCGDHLPYIPDYEHETLNISHCYFLGINGVTNLYDVPMAISVKLGIINRAEVNYKEEYLKIVP